MEYGALRHRDSVGDQVTTTARPGEVGDPSSAGEMTAGCELREGHGKAQRQVVLPESIAMRVGLTCAHTKCATPCSCFFAPSGVATRLLLRGEGCLVGRVQTSTV